MIRLSSLVAVPAALALTVFPTYAQSRGTRAVIDATNARYVAAFNKGDVAGFAKVYAPDATVLAPNMAAIHGQPAIADFWQGAWKSGVRNVRLTTTELYVDGSEATEVGTALLDVQSPDGKVIATDHGKYIVLWKRNAKGEWRWFRDIWNSDLPPAPVAGADGGAGNGGASRAAPGDSVWVVLNFVKPDQRAAFEEFTRIFWGAGLKSSDPATRKVFAQTRVLYPTKADPDGNYTYVYVMDPAVSGGNYSEPDLAHALLPAAEADRILGLLRASTTREQQGFYLTEATRAALGMP